jgi:hypothetical protein
MTQPAPVHVNQFSAGGRFPDGKSSARYDCAVAVGVMMADAGTGGRVRPTTTELRGLQTDQDTNGIGFDDVALALGKRGVQLEHGRKAWPTLTARWRAGDGAGVQGLYSVVPRPYTSQPGGRFGHALYVQRYSRPGWLLVDDPLAATAREWPESVVRNFYFTGLALAAWVTGSSAGGSAGGSSSDGTILAVFSGQSASSCADVRILAPGNAGIGLYPIPHEDIGRPCVECAAGFVPAVVSVGPVQSLQGFTAPQDLPAGAPNACVRAGTKPGDRPSSDPGAVVGNALGSIIDIPALIGGLGDVARNVMLLGFALVALLVGLYILATGDRPRPSLPL